MGKFISFANQKGGVGKTTSAVNIAAALGLSENKTLLIDLDPQGNATSGVGIYKNDFEKSSYDVLTGLCTAKEAIINTKFDNLDLIPTNMSLAGAEFELVTIDSREHMLKNAIESIKDEYDYIICDCPPSLGILTINALVASNGIVVPMQCEYYSLEGLSQLMMAIERIKNNWNHNLDLTGIILTMYNGRLNLTNQVENELNKYYQNKIFKETVPRNVRITEAPGFGEPIIYFDRYSKGSIAYMEIADELCERIKEDS